MLSSQIPNKKLVKKYFIVVKLAQYFVCDEDKKLALYCKQEIWVLKLESCFHKRQVSFLVVKTAKCKRGISFGAAIDMFSNMNSNNSNKREKIHFLLK